MNLTIRIFGHKDRVGTVHGQALWALFLSINLLFIQTSYKQQRSRSRLRLPSMFDLWLFMLGRNNLDKDLATITCTVIRFIYLGKFKREVLIAAVFQLGGVHTHISFVTTHVVTRHTTTVVSCVSNVQSFTELTALTLNKSNNDNEDYGLWIMDWFSLPRQFKTQRVIFVITQCFFVTGSVA